MSDRHALLAFSATLIAICYLATIAAWLAYSGKYAEALGFGGLTTGLVGVIGTFRPRTSGVSDETAKTLTDKIPPATGEAQ
jgi:hypothetical protein